MVEVFSVRQLGWLTVAVVVSLLGVSCSTGAPKLAQPTAMTTSTPSEIAATTTHSPPPSPPASAQTATRTLPAPTAKEESPEPSRIPRPTRTPDEPATPIVVERGTSGRQEIALTIDAGSDQGNAEAILDLLADEGILATFGMTGQWAEANPGLVQRMVEDGHDLINHSWSHPSFTGASTGAEPISAADRRDELRATERFIRERTGYDVRPYFRPPYGDYDDSVLTDIAEAGYTVTVMWSCDSLGWNGAAPEEIVARCGMEASAGDIILLHLGSESTDYDALPALIETISDEGFTFVTVRQLLAP